jgi:predicted DNA binding protein
MTYLAYLRVYTYRKVIAVMFEVTFKVQHDCPYTRFTIKHPDVRLVEWCNNRIHVMEVDVPDIETFARIESDLNELLVWKGGKVLKKNFLGGNLQLIVKTCCCNKIRPNISEIVEKNSCLGIPPEIFYGGWEEYRVIGFRENDYKRMFQELDQIAQVKIVQKRVLPEKSIRDTFVVSLNSVFSDLTEKQVNSLISALESGYYQIPKRVTTKQIAGKQKVPRTTYEEHLRKAESKILQAIAPYVRLYSSGEKEPKRTLEITAQ